MEKTREKDLLYQHLADLTREAKERDRYFSVAEIFDHIHKGIVKDMGDDYHKSGQRKFNLKDGTVVWLSDISPRTKTCHANLEELVDGGRVQIARVLAEEIGRTIHRRFYRAVL